ALIHTLDLDMHDSLLGAANSIRRSHRLIHAMHGLNQPFWVLSVRHSFEPSGSRVHAASQTTAVKDAAGRTQAARVEASFTFLSSGMRVLRLRRTPKLRWAYCPRPRRPLRINVNPPAPESSSSVAGE